MIKNDIETAMALWDALDDEAEVFVPIILNSGGAKNYFFIEKSASPVAQNKMFLRVFINRDEADTYKLKKRSPKMTLAMTTVGHLLSALDRNLAREVDKDIDCVLSTLDMEGNFYAIETLWSNNSKPS